MRRFLLAISLQLSVISLLAADITPQQALDIANQFVQKDKTAQKAIHRAPAGTKIAPTIAHKMPSRIAQNKDNVYIVNLGNNQGFVVVSGETGTDADVLGYCDHGSFNYDDAPIQLKDLLDNYSAGIDSLRVGSALGVFVIIPAGSYMGEAVVEPLLTSQWNQTAEYNAFTPHNYPAGCGPVAVGQVMRFWRWPEVTRDSVFAMKEDSTYGYIDFSGRTYDWDNMPDFFGYNAYMTDYYSYTNEEVEAVGRLLADIGLAMNTHYTPEGSPTPWDNDEIIKNFRYEPDMETVVGEHVTEVRDELISELKAGRPVIYVGCPTEGDCHALVCDGYTTNSYFHFNYGWGGGYDGFYRLATFPLYPNSPTLWTKFRPYVADIKVIGDFKYGLLPTGKADILEYQSGDMYAENGALIIPNSVTDPETDQTYTVTRIRTSAFNDKGHFTKITIGNNIDAIERYSFIKSKIDTVVLSDNMTQVPDSAFLMGNVKHLIIGENVKRIGKRAFYLCPLNQGIVCKSPAFEVGEEAFAHSKPAEGDWTNRITKIDKKAFLGAEFQRWVTFDKLEVLNDSAFYGVMFGRGSQIFRIGPKVREIAQSAFDGWNDFSAIPLFTADSLNPYFSTDDSYPNIYNKNKTCLLISMSSQYAGWPSSLVKIEPGAVRTNCGSYTIPNTIIDMELAFAECENLETYPSVTCPLPVPPQISDETFNDKLFDENNMPYLYVPQGTYDLYAAAPGWRKFGDYIIDDQPFEPFPQQDLQYNMVIHSDSIPTMVAISDVTAMRVSENEEGESIVSIGMNQRGDLTVFSDWIDSITWKPGFVFDNAEVFELNDSTWTAEAQKCTITLSPTVFDGNAQLAVRYSALTPRPVDGVTRGLAIDVELLTDQGSVHELSGVAFIKIPFRKRNNESVCAAYYNEELGQWEPMFYEYDDVNGIVTIMTGHFSSISVFSVEPENGSKMMHLYNRLNNTLLGRAYTLQVDILMHFLGSEDPRMDMITAFKDDMGLYQAIGLDGFYQAVISITDPLIKFKPEAIDNALGILGEVGTALTILDVIRADLKGDDISVAAGTLKVLLAKSIGVTASWIGTAVSSASMAMVAFIGVALEKFGTYVKNYKLEYYRAAYKYYYSVQGYKALGTESVFKNDGPHSYFRTPKDWYDYFYPAFTEGKMNDRQLKAYIEQSVRMYCNRFWDESGDFQTSVFVEMEKRGYTQYYWEPESMMNTISNEYFAELMNGQLVAVFTALRDKQIEAAADRAYEKQCELEKILNTKLLIRIKDSSCQKGDTSQYAGWRIGFCDVSDKVPDKENWTKTLNTSGNTEIGWLTIMSLVDNCIPTKLVLYTPDGEPKTWYKFEISGMTGKQIINVDIATGGATVDNMPVEGLTLTYNPDHVIFPQAGFDMTDHFDPHIQDYYVYVHDSAKWYGNVRLSMEIERFLNRHDFIRVDSLGNYTIGSDLTGQLVGDSASGSFVLDTDYKFYNKSMKQFIDCWNNPQMDLAMRMNPVLNGSMKHSIACQYTLKRIEVEDHYEYEITYTGEGLYNLSAEYICTFIKGMDWWTMVSEGKLPELEHYYVNTGTYEGGGDVTLEYKTTLK